MEIKDISEIVEMMEDHDLCEFEMEDQGFRLAMKRRGGAEPAIVVSAPAAAAPAAPAPVAAAAPAAAPAPAPAAKSEDDGLAEIKSPIVGTFYRASSPDSEPYISVGQEVEEDTVVCIVEAMKVMNEIKAEVRGTIKKVLVENATAVQFGQALFKVEPR